MYLTWITITPKLRQGIQILNAIDTSEFSILLQELLNKAGITSSSLLNLGTNLHLESNTTELLLQTIVHIFKQSSKIILKPTTLQKQLVEDLQLTNDKAVAFVKVWTSQTKEDFGSFDERLKLEKISWELNLESCSFLEPKKIMPNLRLKLSLHDSQDNHSKNVVVQMEKKELQQLYHAFENIQNKFDICHKFEE